jgi:hypothetical protein
MKYAIGVSRSFHMVFFVVESELPRSLPLPVQTIPVATAPGTGFFYPVIVALMVSLHALTDPSRMRQRSM